MLKTDFGEDDEEESLQDPATLDGSVEQDAEKEEIRQRIEGFRATFQAKDAEEAKVPTARCRPYRAPVCDDPCHDRLPSRETARRSLRCWRGESRPRYSMQRTVLPSKLLVT